MLVVPAAAEYYSVLDVQDEDQVRVTFCEAFKQIGERFNRFGYGSESSDWVGTDGFLIRNSSVLKKKIECLYATVIYVTNSLVFSTT